LPAKKARLFYDCPDQYERLEKH